MRCWRSCDKQLFSVLLPFCNADACLCQHLIVSAPQATKLSMCSKRSSQVITPGVESGSTNAGHCAHFGYAPTSLHMSSQMPANWFCKAMRCWRSCDKQLFSVLLPFCNADACLCQPLIVSAPQATKLSMCSKSSPQVITPAVESGSTNLGHCAHFGYAPTSLHMSSQMPDNLFCT